MPTIGPPEWIVILAVLLLVLGGDRLVKLAGEMGKAIGAFRNEVDEPETTEPETEQDETEDEATPETPPAQKPLTFEEIREEVNNTLPEEQLRTALTLVFDLYGLNPYRLDKEAERTYGEEKVHKATIGRWLAEDREKRSHPQQEKLAQTLSLIPNLSPDMRHWLMQLAGYPAGEIRPEFFKPIPLYLSCHGQDLAQERARLESALRPLQYQQLPAFELIAGEATWPDDTVKSRVQESDFMILVQGRYWEDIRAMERQAAGDITAFYFHKEGTTPQPEAAEFQQAVGAEHWQPFSEPDELARLVFQRLYDTVHRRLTAGQPVSMPAVMALYLVNRFYQTGQTSLAGLLRRLLESGGEGRLESVREEARQPAPARHPEEPELVTIPAGRFWMGTDRWSLALAGVEWKDWMKDETPYHRLYLPEYAIGRYPVTNAEYGRFIRDGGYRQRAFWTEAGWRWKESENRTQPWWWDDEKWNKADLPVVGVSWHEAVAYSRWLAKITGRPYQLPSEAEWEKAARGPEGRIWPWGNRWDPDRCNIHEKGPGRTTPVGTYSPAGDSYYGVADMAGNVWEWTRSLHRDYPYDPEDGREKLQSKGDRTLRGGSWLSVSRRSARLSYRNLNLPDYFDGSYGLRLVVAPV